MTEHTLVWKVGHEAMGPLLAAAVEEMNAHGPFAVGDEATETAPRYTELVGGVFRVMSPASWSHGITTTALARLVDSLLAGRGLVGSHLPVKISPDTLREADVAVYLGRSAGDAEGAAAYPAFVPDLVVEVLSASTAREDRGPKQADYQRLGVQEYYLLDPKGGEAEAFVLRDGDYVPLERSPEGFPSSVLGQSWDPASALPKRTDE